MMDPISNKYYLPKQSQKGNWVSIYNYRPKNEAILERKGEVFAVLSLKSDPEFDLITAGGIFLDFFHETYFESRESSTLKALEETVISSGKHLEKLIDKDPKVSESGIQLDIIAMAIVDNYAYFVKAGNTLLEILREEKRVNLLPALKDPTGEEVVGIASMELKSGDRFLLGTEAVSDSFKKDKIEKVLSEFDSEVLEIDERSDHKIAMMHIAVGHEDSEQNIEGTLSESVMVDDEVLEDEDEIEMENEEENQKTVIEDEIEDEDLENTEELVGGDEEALDESEDVKEIDEGDSNYTAEEPKKDKTYQVMLAKIVPAVKAIPMKIKGIVKEKNVNDNVKLGKKEYPRNMIIIIIVIVVLAAGLYLGVRKAVQSNQSRLEQEQTDASLTALESKIDEIEGLVLEIQSSDSNEQRGQGLELVDEAKLEVNSLKEVESAATKVAEYENRLQSAEDFFNRTIPVTDKAPLVDIASFFPDAVVSDLVISENKIYLTDSGLGKVYSVNLDGTELTELVSDLENPSSLAVDNNGKIIFLDNNKDNRMAVLDPQTKSMTRLAGTSPDKLGTVAAIDFSDILGGRLYLIDQSGTQIMYMQRSGENYGLPVSRFTLTELNTGKDLQIVDNKIYAILQFEEGLYRFLDGQDDTPQFTGLSDSDNMLGAEGLFVDGVNIYFADPVNSRVMVFDKGVETARFKGKYVYRGEGDAFKTMKDIVVAGKNIYVIANNSIYKLDLSALDEL